jgi:hypothetical protein
VVAVTAANTPTPTTEVVPAGGVSRALELAVPHHTSEFGELDRPMWAGKGGPMRTRDTGHERRTVAIRFPPAAD